MLQEGWSPRSLVAAFGLPLLACLLQGALWPVFSPFAWLLFYPAAFGAPYLGGPSSGMVATLLSGALAFWRFVPDSSAGSLASLGVFLALGFAFSGFHYRVRHLAQEAQADRDARQKLQAEAQKQTDLLQGAIECINDPFWIYDAADTLVVFNGAYVELSRALSVEVVLGMPFREIYQRAEPHLVFDSPEQRAAFRRDRLAAKGAIADSYDFRLEDGRYFLVKKRLMRDGSVVHIAFDRTLERQASAHLSISASAFEAINDPFWVYDTEDRLVSFNASFRNLCAEFGCALTVGMPFQQIYAALAPHLEYADPADKQATAALRAARNQQANVDTRLKDGRLFAIRRRLLPDGKQVFIGFEKTHEERRARELEQARLAAESANRSKTEFLTSMSHELRTPMNAVLGFAQLMRGDKKTPLSERHQEMIGHVLESGQHLLALIDDVLDLARIESEAVNLSLEPVRPDDILAGALTTLKPAADKAQVAISIGNTSDAVVLADPRRLLQLVLNLASNAIKYNHAGGKVTLAIETCDGSVRLVVADDGMGVPLEARGKLFQPFYRAGREAGPITGTGIGLTITQRLAALMNGTVGYEPLEPGSRFWIEVPSCDWAPPIAVSGSNDAAAPPTSGSLARGSLLYVEDNAANVDFLRACIATHPELRLRCAGDAEQGLQLAAAEAPDLLLLDIHLPGLSGIEALAKFRQLPGMARTPAVAISASAFASDRERALAAGFEAYLPKPVAVDALEAELARLLAAPGSPSVAPAQAVAED